MKTIGPLCTLPSEEILEITSMSAEAKSRYIISGYVDFTNQNVMLFRGDGMGLVAPMSMFTSRTVSPDFDSFSISDYGQTLVFGEYETSVESILYDLDPKYKLWADGNKLVH